MLATLIATIAVPSMVINAPIASVAMLNPLLIDSITPNLCNW